MDIFHIRIGGEGMGPLHSKNLLNLCLGPPPSPQENLIIHSLQISLDPCMCLHNDCIYVLMEFYEDDI